jgi:2-phospho-L-lactate/phosphoenolpyruvate guanylyltransferase
MLSAVLAIVPVRGRDGKHRLDGFLDADERARLVEAMLADVLAACAGARSVERTLVVTPDPTVAPDGIDVLEDDGVGHAPAVESALDDPRARAGALVVMADCPLVTPAALDVLAEAAAPLALVPANDGGVNALALRPADAVRPLFGVPGAARETLARARAAGVEAAVLEEPALSFDVDRPADVWKLRESAADSRAREALTTILPPTAGLL